MDVSPVLHRLAATWRKTVGTAVRQLLLAAFLLALCAGAHLARLGTPAARLGAVAALVGVVVVALWRWRRERRDWFDLRRTIRRVLSPSEPELGARALRAANLMQRAREDAGTGSPELARAHFERVVARASLPGVEAAAKRRARVFGYVTFAALMASFAAFVVGPARVIEGLNVLMARKGRAPLPMLWLDSVRVTAQPPAYLRKPERSVLYGLDTRVDQGTLLTVRGAPMREGRHLVLTDGKREVPFISDGQGGVQARWTVDSDATLSIAARFGEVLVVEPEQLAVESVPDTAPVVLLDGAPRTVKLADEPRVELAYQALDDHGLRQIDVVLRAAGREDRRVLARLDGDSVMERGGYALTARDPFLRRMFLPVVVTVEARDADPISGPKWGVSEPVTLVPPTVGEPEANRYRALLGVQKLLTDFLAWQMVDKKGIDKITERAAEERRRSNKVSDAMKEALDEIYGGLVVPNGLRAFLLGQMRVLSRPLRAGESAQHRSEEVLLGVDVALRSLSTVDARSVSKRLGDVAEEAADGAKQARETEQRKVGEARVNAALGALRLGIKELSALGPLGADLGSVATGDLGRIERSRKAQDLTHTELAARHLAARLRQANPSFGAGRRGGVESGVPGQNGGQMGEPSEAQKRFDRLAQELEQLAQEHADEIGTVERSLSDAEQSVDLDALRDEARQRAEAVRRALSDLPQTGSEPGSARAQGALGREHAGSMAQSLERLSLADAVQSGKDAVSALREARRKAKDPERPADWLDEQTVRDAEKAIQAELDWAERQLAKLREQSEAKAKQSLSESGQREGKLSRRTGNLAARGKDGETALPADALDALEQAEAAMQRAARSLAQGKGAEGLEHQREAQRLLERASTGQSRQGDQAERQQQPREGDDSGGEGIRTGGKVPDADDGQRAADFRRRVLEGLGKSRDGRLAPAVRRYAEGLLR